MDKKKLFLGVTAGLASAAAVTALVKSQKGKELLTTLQGNLQDAKAKLSDVSLQTNEVKSAINEFTNMAKNNIPQIINDVKATVLSFKDDIEPSTQNLKEEISALQQSIGEIEKNITELKEIPNK